jgi:DNA-binding PadR family transcriptional regulator
LTSDFHWLNISLYDISIFAISLNNIARRDLFFSGISKVSGKGGFMIDLESKARAALPLTEAAFYVLVSLVEPRHGYGIMRNVSSISGNRASLGPGTLYGALTHMVKSGWIVRTGEQEMEGERRKIYALTELGRRILILETERLAALAEIGRRILGDITGK